MPRGGHGGVGAIVLATLLAPLAVATPATAGEAVPARTASECVAACAADREACGAAAGRKTRDCDRQRRDCEDACAFCAQLQAPPAMVCLHDCEACRANLARASCTAGRDTGCGRAYDACVARCGR